MGILSVEHDPLFKEVNNSDGVCLTLLVSCDTTSAKLGVVFGLQWKIS